VPGRALAALAAGAACIACASRAVAQTPVVRAPVDTGTTRPTLLGTPAEQRDRDRQLLGVASPAGFLLRSASQRGEAPPRAGLRTTPITPDVRAVWNSALPYSLNDGALWAGRGLSAIVRGGVDMRYGRVRVLLLPEATFSQNRPFEFRADTGTGRSAFAWPWGTARYDIDLPSRFGDQTWRLLSLGQSAIVVDAGPVATGATTENDWWGPGSRAALVLSDNAEGYPHAFVRTRRPLATPIGAVEAQLQLGALTPSLFTDSAPPSRWRSISAFAATLRPANGNVTVGLTRSVVTAMSHQGDATSHALDAIARWQSDVADSSHAPTSDQYASLFARWIIARAGAELYAEFAREGTPKSLREVLIAPHERGAITYGLRAYRPATAARRTFVRVLLEGTSVEQSRAFRDEPTPQPFYTGVAARDGYTQRGQLLGAAIGPGASSQWISTDVVRREGEVGLFVSRIRWNNDALYTEQNPTFFKHDATTSLGVRGLASLPRADVQVEGTWARRYNYLFQNGFANPANLRTVDVTNVTLSLSVTPR
jgi:Capsule assembly protein Wzi